jgi:type VI secretion system protein ImpL
VQVLELQARMKEAFSQLKRSKAGRGRGSALYTLPWYVIIGPPAAGKTTALQQSGLTFMQPGGGSPRIRGTAGTKNCDWWFSNEAILLDTAGRFVTDDDDEAEWFAFLETVRRFRGRKPLDGILVAVSIADLIGDSGAAIDDMAERLRSTVDEVLARLDLVLPMYVVFTKSDLIGGFDDRQEDNRADAITRIRG